MAFPPFSDVEFHLFQHQKRRRSTLDLWILDHLSHLSSIKIGKEKAGSNISVTSGLCLIKKGIKIAPTLNNAEAIFL